MKSVAAVMMAASFLIAVCPAHAEIPHDHAHDAPAGGPRGGRLLEQTHPHAEVLVEKDRTITVAFYDESLQPVAAADQHVSVIADADGIKTTLEFEKRGDQLVSTSPLPNADAVNLVVRFKQSPDETVRNIRFVFEDDVCQVCQRAEYACICGH